MTISKFQRMLFAFFMTLLMSLYAFAQGADELELNRLWNQANFWETSGNIEKTIETTEKYVKLYRKKHIDNMPFIWVIERSLANKYSDIGNRLKDIEISNRIVKEARQFNDSLLLSEKLIDLGISYERDHTIDGRVSSMTFFEEALSILSKLKNTQSTNAKILETLDLLAGEYVLCAQYNKAIDLFNTYEMFLNRVDNKTNNKSFIHIMIWKCSTFQHLNFSLPGSREKAKEIHSQILEYERNTHGEESVQYLSQLRVASLAYQYSDTLELDNLYLEGFGLWQRILQKEEYEEYVSFLESYLTYLYHKNDITKINVITNEIEHLILQGKVDLHTRISFYYNRSVYEYNNCNYNQAQDYIDKAKIECEGNREVSEIGETLAKVLCHKSMVAFGLGRYDLAKECAYTAYGFVEKNKSDNLTRSDILYSLSYIMDYLGEKEKATELSTEAFLISYKCEGNNISLDKLYSTIHRLDARSQIWAIDNIHLESIPDNPMVVDFYILKAAAFSKIGEFEDAGSSLYTAEKKLDYFKNTPYYQNKKIYDYAKSQILYHKGILAQWRKDYAQAISYFNDYRHQLGKDDCCLWLNTLYALVKDSINFEKESTKTIDYLRKEIKNNFIYLSDHERELYMTQILSYAILELESYASLYPEQAIARKNAFKAVLLEKGLALATSSGIKDLIDSTSINTTRLDLLGEQYNLAQNEESRSSLQLKISLEEQEIQKKIGDELANCVNKLMVEIDDIQEQVDSQCAVIEFLKVISLSEKTQKFRYGALILTQENDSPIYVDICSEEELVLLKEKGSTIYDEKSIDVYRIIWEPLIPHIGGKKYIYFSPTGLLHFLNIELIAQENTHGMDFIRISSSRELCNHGDDSSRKSDVILFGGLCYDCELQEGKSKDRDHIQLELGDDSITRSGITFLAGSLKEINNISQIASFNNIKYTIYSGKDGSELNYKQLSGKEVPVLHLSTHGFSFGHETIAEYDDPMRRCGLLLSSSQLAWNGIYKENSEDGILLGEEIANVRIKNNELVVLSTCESGLGEITSEGVWGLQRAFKKAGAKTIIMSLWKVDDFSTNLFMTKFYTCFFSGMAKKEAFYMAQKEVRDFTDSEGNKIFQDPYYWAGFIMLD